MEGILQPRSTGYREFDLYIDVFIVYVFRGNIRFFKIDV